MASPPLPAVPSPMEAAQALNPPPPVSPRSGPKTASSPALESSGAEAVESLLRDLGHRLCRGTSLPKAGDARCPTGLPGLDDLLHGGLLRGDLSEIAGPACSGRTSLALSLLARSTAAGELVAVVDVADAFDPVSAHEAGVVLERVLWARVPGFREALRAIGSLLEARGFAVILLDLADLALAGRDERELARHARVWPRLRKQLAGTDSALVVVGAQRVARSFADLALELQPTRAHFSGRPALLQALEGEVLLARNRRGQEDRRVRIQW